MYFFSSCWKKVSIQGHILVDITKSACPLSSNNTSSIKINNWVYRGKRKKNTIPETTVSQSDVYQTLPLSSSLNDSAVRTERYQYIWNLASSFTGQPQDLFCLLLCCVLNMFYSQNIGKLWLWETPLEFMQTQLAVAYGSFHWDGKNHPADPE